MNEPMPTCSAPAPRAPKGYCRRSGLLAGLYEYDDARTNISIIMLGIDTTILGSAGFVRTPRLDFEGVNGVSAKELWQPARCQQPQRLYRLGAAHKRLRPG